MLWARVPFGKYTGKTLPEILVRDPDWFFWVLPKLYGKLASEAQDLARKARAIKILKSDQGKWEVEYRYEFGDRFAVLDSLKPVAPSICDGRQDGHTST